MIRFQMQIHESSQRSKGRESTIGAKTKTKMVSMVERG